MTVTAAADRLWPALWGQVERLSREHGKPAVIPLSTYQTDHDLAVLRPEDGGQWTAAFHHEVMLELSRRLSERGMTTRLVPLDAADYLRWLASRGLKNDAGTRAAFIGEIVG